MLYFFIIYILYILIFNDAGTGKLTSSLAPSTSIISWPPFDIKKLTTDESFIHLEKRFQKERARYLAKMLDRDTTPEETLQIKSVVNALETLSPMALAEKVLKIEVKNRKVAHPDMFKVQVRNRLRINLELTIL